MWWENIYVWKEVKDDELYPEFIKHIESLKCNHCGKKYKDVYIEEYNEWGETRSSNDSSYCYYTIDVACECQEDEVMVIPYEYVTSVDDDLCGNKSYYQWLEKIEKGAE